MKSQFEIFNCDPADQLCDHVMAKREATKQSSPPSRIAMTVSRLTKQ